MNLTLTRSIGLSLLSSMVSLGYVFQENKFVYKKHNTTIYDTVNKDGEYIHQKESYEMIMNWLPPQ